MWRGWDLRTCASTSSSSLSSLGSSLTLFLTWPSTSRSSFFSSSLLSSSSDMGPPSESLRPLRCALVPPVAGAALLRALLEPDADRAGLDDVEAVAHLARANDRLARRDVERYELRGEPLLRGERQRREHRHFVHEELLPRGSRNVVQGSDA